MPRPTRHTAREHALSAGRMTSAWRSAPARPGPGALLSVLLSVLLAGCVFETSTQPPRVLFMGNSITRHAPLPEAGWVHDWGMAASARENDYVHQTVRLLAARGLQVEAHVADRDCPDCDGAIDEQIRNMDQVEALKPRYVIVQLAEHSREIELRSGKMSDQYRQLLEGLADQGVPHVYCLGSWGETGADGPYAQAIHYAVRDFPGVRFLPIHSLSADSANYGDTALFRDRHVLWHPGDRGMLEMARVVADALWEDR